MMKLSEKTRRKLKYGTGAIIVIVVVAVLAILLNVLLEQLPMSVDITSESLYSITDETKTVLDELEKDVTVYALFDKTKASTQGYSEIINYLDIYDSYSHVDVEYIDLDKNPGFLLETVGEEQVNDYSAGDCIVKCGDKIKHIVSNDMYEVTTDTQTYQQSITGINCEACLTGGIIHVISDEIPVVYVSTGFGEKTLDSFKKVKLNIENNNFEIKEINLNRDDVPDDAAVVMFINPTSDLSTTALGRLKTWFIKTNGNVIAVMDYSAAGTEYTNFNALFELFSLRIRNDIVTETDEYSMLPNNRGFAATTLSPDDSPLEGLSQKAIFINDTRSIEVLNTTSAYSESNALVNTSDKATSSSIKTGEEITEKLTVAASGAYQAGNEVSKLYLTGSSYNLTDDSIATYGNGGGAILIRALNWMYKSLNEGDLIPAKEYNTDVISITQSQATTIAIILLAILPVIALAFGFIVWIKRRHL